MKKYIQSTVFVIFAIVSFLGLAKAIASYENPFNLYENPLVWILIIVFAIAIILKEIVNVTAINKATALQMEKDGIDPSTVDENAWINNLIKKWTKTKAIESEEEIVLDHNYDGIRELDNVLPPWWVYMFYATIIFGVIYLVRFEVLDGDNQIVEYEKEVAQARIEIAKYKKSTPNVFDESKITLLTDEASLNRGKAVFEMNCVACHMADGGGGIGPNLTDKNWILGGGIKNVFNTITKGGRDGKGMVAWGKTIKPNDRVKVASYVLSLQGTTPANPKAPQGDVWEEK